jgi:hypothetical protein
MKTVDMTTIGYLGSNYRLLETDVTIDFLSSSIIDFFNIFPIRFIFNFKKMILNIIR